MKNADLPSSRPRLLCRVVRQWSVVASSDDSRHVAACADCQAFFNRMSALDSALHRDALRAAVDVPEDLERKILQTVRAGTDRSARDAGSSRRFGPWLALGMGVAGVAAVAMLLNTPARPGRSAEPVANVAHHNKSGVSTETQFVVNAVQTFSNQLVGKVLPSTGEFVANNPLQQEIESIYTDARLAVNFLAMNFLPRSQDVTRPPRSG